MSNTILVFGSNTAGIHGAGAALYAYRKKGAQWGRGVGHYGDSYALPTKNRNIRTLPMKTIKEYVEQFIQYAKHHPELTFGVTRVGCGLAGLTDAQMAPLFQDAPDNCQFDTAWEFWLPGKKFWGTF